MEARIHRPGCSRDALCDRCAGKRRRVLRIPAGIDRGTYRTGRRRLPPPDSQRESRHGSFQQRERQTRSGSLARRRRLSRRRVSGARPHSRRIRQTEVRKGRSQTRTRANRLGRSRRSDRLRSGVAVRHREFHRRRVRPNPPRCRRCLSRLLLRLGKRAATAVDRSLSAVRSSRARFSLELHRRRCSGGSRAHARGAESSEWRLGKQRVRRPFQRTSGFGRLGDRVPALLGRPALVAHSPAAGRSHVQSLRLVHGKRGLAGRRRASQARHGI